MSGPTYWKLCPPCETGHHAFCYHMMQSPLRHGVPLEGQMACSCKLIGCGPEEEISAWDRWVTINDATAILMVEPEEEHELAKTWMNDNIASGKIISALGLVNVLQVMQVLADGEPW